MSSWAVHSSPRSDQPFSDYLLPTNGSLHTQGSLRNIYSIYKSKKKKKKKIGNPIKITQRANKACPAFNWKCIFAIAKFAWVISSNMQLLNLSVSYPVALQQYLSYMNETLTVNRRFCWHRHSSCSCTLKGQYGGETQGEMGMNGDKNKDEWGGGMYRRK